MGNGMLRSELRSEHHRELFARPLQVHGGFDVTVTSITPSPGLPQPLHGLISNT